MPGALYGADVAGVKAIVPHLELGDDSIPTEAQAVGFLELVSTWVDAALGPLTLVDPERVDRVLAGAKGVVELGASALAEDAAHPESAGPTTSSYGTRLWERYDKALEGLLDSVGRGREGGDAGAGEGVTVGVPAVYTPPPMFRRRRGF